jgi:DNA invertase Pin-like site-specific DNA recombinase
MTLIKSYKKKSQALPKHKSVDTRTSTGKFFLTIMARFSMLDRIFIKEKKREDIELAKQKGEYKGRTKKYTDKHVGMKHVIELYKQGDKIVKERYAK